jgi:hypothetical protein
MDKQYPLPVAEQDMYDMYYYDDPQRAQTAEHQYAD